jgi:exosome complex RNA-binding protein Csl4
MDSPPATNLFLIGLKRRGATLYCPNCAIEVKRKIATGHYTA